MRLVAPHTLCLGNSGDTRDLVAVRRAGIAALVDLALSERPLTPPRELAYCRFPIQDGSGNDKAILRAAIHTTAALLEARVTTLVFCSAGMSRSPAIAAAALSLLTKQPAAKCLEDLVPGGGIDVSPALWGDVLAVLTGSAPDRNRPFWC